MSYNPQRWEASQKQNKHLRGFDCDTIFTAWLKLN